jgi:hypothetical protein
MCQIMITMIPCNTSLLGYYLTDYNDFLIPNIKILEIYLLILDEG